MRRQIVSLISQSIRLFSLSSAINTKLTSPRVLPASSHLNILLSIFLVCYPNPPMQTVSSFSPSPGWQGCRVPWCGLEPQCSVGCRRLAVGLCDAATPRVCQVSVCGVKKEGDLIEQGQFILCGFKRVTLWKKEREREAKRPLIAYKSSSPCYTVSADWAHSARIIHKAIKYVSVVSQAHCRLCFMSVVLDSAAGHHKLALLSVCQSLSLYRFNILSPSLFICFCSFSLLLSF